MAYVVKSRDSDSVQNWGQFVDLDDAQDRVLDVISAGLEGTHVLSARWQARRMRFCATCETDGETSDFCVWIAPVATARDASV